MYSSIFKVQRIVAVTLGAQQVAYSRHLVTLNLQSFGALAGIALTTLWAGRKLALSSTSTRDNQATSLQTKPNFAVWGILIGIAGLSFFYMASWFIAGAGLAILSLLLHYFTGSYSIPGPDGRSTTRFSLYWAGPDAT